MSEKYRLSKPVVITAAILLLITIICLGVWVSRPAASVPASSDPDTASASGDSSAREGLYAESQLFEMIKAVAAEKFGEDSFILHLSTEGASLTEIHGVPRSVHVYAADSRSAYEKNGKIRGLFYIDANTGEIFDNSDGEMKKINNGE